MGVAVDFGALTVYVAAFTFCSPSLYARSLSCPSPKPSPKPVTGTNLSKQLSYQLSAISYQLSAISYQQQQNSHYHAVLSSSLMPSKPRPTIHPPPPGEHKPLIASHSPLPTAHRKPATLCSMSGSQLTRVTQLTQPCYLLSMLLAIAVV